MKDNSYILYLLSFIPTYVYWEINELLSRGVNVQILALGNSFRAAMWKNIIGSDQSGNSYINDKLIKRFPIDTRELNGSEAYDKAAEDISEFLLQEPINRIHVHFAKKEAQIGMRLAKILGVPFSVSTHSNDIFVPQNKDELRYLLNESPLIFSISEFSKKCVESYLNKNNTNPVKAIHLGIKMDKLPRRIKPGRSFYSIYCTASGLVDAKGIQYLIRACEILKVKEFFFECSIIGSDPDGKVLYQLKEQIKNLGLSEQVKFPGIVSSKNLLQQIASCDAFVLPCAQADNGSMDGIPVSLIEAMGIGVPVVSTSISGIPELISNGENGLLVPPKNPQAIAEALIYIFENPLKSERMGNSARQTVQNSFSVERYVNQLMNYWGINNSSPEVPSLSSAHLSFEKNSHS